MQSLSAGVWCLIIAQTTAFVSSLVYYGYKAGRLLEKIDGHEKRILRLENKVFYEEIPNE